MNITKNNALELWKEAIKLIMDQGKDFIDNDNRTCREINNLTLNLEDVNSSEIDEPIMTMMDSKKWVYPSKEELSSIVFKEFQAPIYEYTYGGRIFSFNEGFDQVNSFVIPLLKKDPNSRRAILVFYNPIEDSKPNNKNTPGIIYIQFRIIESKLNMTCHIRSNDLFFGWPANIYQMHSLMNFISKKLEIQTGTITTFSNSAHIFTEDLSEIEDVLKI